MKRVSAGIVLATLGIVLAGCSDITPELRVAQPSSPSDRAIVADLVELLDEHSRLSFIPSDVEMSGEEALEAVLAGTVGLAVAAALLPDLTPNTVHSGAMVKMFAASPVPWPE